MFVLNLISQKLTHFITDGVLDVLGEIVPLLGHAPEPALDSALGGGARRDGAVGQLLPLGLGVAVVAGPRVGPDLILAEAQQHGEALLHHSSGLVHCRLAHTASMRTRFHCKTRKYI